MASGEATEYQLKYEHVSVRAGPSKLSLQFALLAPRQTQGERRVVIAPNAVILANGRGSRNVATCLSSSELRSMPRAAGFPPVGENDDRLG